MVFDLRYQTFMDLKHQVALDYGKMGKLLDNGHFYCKYKWNQEQKGVVALVGLKLLRELVKLLHFGLNNVTKLVTLKLERFPLLVLCIYFEFIGWHLFTFAEECTSSSPPHKGRGSKSSRPYFVSLLKSASARMIPFVRKMSFFWKGIFCVMLLKGRMLCNLRDWRIKRPLSISKPYT